MPRPRVLILAFACLLLAVFLSGCAPTLTDVTVVGEKYTPAHTDLIPITHWIGKTPVTIMTPIDRADSFELEVKDVESEKREWWNVSNGTFDQIFVGERLHRSTDGTLDIVHPPD